MHKELSVGEQWTEVLREGGYEPVPLTPSRFARINRYTRIWRRLHRLLAIRPEDTFFEFGCGGGQHLVPLALHGHRVSGIDVSRAVLDRCEAYIKDVENFTGRLLPIKLTHGEFLNYSSPEQYDVVFNFGVIEHFLDDAERLSALEKMLSLTKPGGHIVSVVPNGIHPLRTRQREEHLGGYNVPEVDYDKQMATAELNQINADDARVYPANLFGYLTSWPARNPLESAFFRTAYYAAQLIPPADFGFALRHAGSLIIIAQRSVGKSSDQP